MDRAEVSDKRPRTVQGGWLGRIKAGTAAVFSEALAESDPDPDVPDVCVEDAPPPPPPMTPRLLDILRRMVPPDPDAEAPWVYATGLARETGIPRGTVTPLLARLETHGWARSALDDQQHVRRFQLSETGVDGAREEFGAAAPEPPRRAAGTRPAPARREESRRESDRAEMPALSARFVAAAPTGERGWTMDELAKVNPDLAAAVRRRLAAER